MSKSFDLRTHTDFNKLKNSIEKDSKYRNMWQHIAVGGVPIEYIDVITNQINKYSYIITTVNTNSINQFIKSLYSYKVDQINYSNIVKELFDYNLENVDKVTDKGEFSIKGDTVIAWPFLYDNPIKLNFFDEDIESAEIFDISINKKISDISEIILGDENLLEEKSILLNLVHPEKSHQNRIVTFRQFNTECDIDFNFKQPRLFFNRLDLVEDYLKKFEDKDYSIQIITNRKDQLSDKLKNYITKNSYPSGIISNEIKSIILTDREIFGTIFLRNEIKNNMSSSRSRQLLSEFEGEVEIDDYIVHEDHGIGTYKGIQQEEFSGNKYNYIQIEYAEGDEILVPLNMVYKITKYIGLDGKKPQITRLHKGNWEKQVNKTKAQVKILARDLARHYAKISLAQANAVEDDTSDMYEQFVEKFEHKETPDQLRSIAEVENDLSSDKPMNRLLIGDVGFGKTEVIMRAAYKVAESGMQVAILSPTTILVSQHLDNFTERFKEFPMEIGALYRFNDKWENKDVVEKIKNGDINIVIGTHRLLSNDIEFDNLGLVVIDEEQKFGVKQKEKLKKIQYGVHVLSTTATPIPRTLSMALSSIQDISTIQTPPPGRKPVNIDVSKMDWTKIRDAIQKEMSRDGQIFIIHNSVRTIKSIANKVKSYIPEAKIAVAHGQMSGKKIEQIMNDFLHKKYDCLISTTIVENGIDIQNVNSLIVLKAQNFGLSQLYQLKGRIGRSDREAYAYFFYDGVNLDKKNNEKLSETEEKQMEKPYVKRLQAMKEADDLGAGFDIATKDLEIRGAGNLLGSQQHGNINKVGLGLYMQMLAQEIERLKNSK